MNCWNYIKLRPILVSNVAIRKLLGDLNNIRPLLRLNRDTKTNYKCGRRGSKMLSRRVIKIPRRLIFAQSKTWEPELTTAKKHEIEAYWSSRLESDQPSAPLKPKDNDKRENFYVLSMFPYPSGKLHMGHVRVYTISDALARFYRMNGKDVIHPMGWDAFGLPAENAAIDRKIPPQDWTWTNIAHMKQQLKKLGCSFDWEREVATCSPEYYRWTQYLFLKLYESGLVYQKEAMVNWDPVDKTVLAEEQVDQNGCSWRSGAKVEKRLLKQWFIRTTRFSEALYKGLDHLHYEDWKDITKLQRHWIGDCSGYQFHFALDGNPSTNVTVWTPEPERLSQVLFIALSPCHVLNREEFLEESTDKLPGIRKLKYQAVNPLTKREISLIVVHDPELIAFPHGSDTFVAFGDDGSIKDFAHKSGLTIEEISGISEEMTREQICDKALKEGWGGYATSSKLRDWLISRQRYWGTPIPVIHCSKCGPLPIPYEKLPVELPKIRSVTEKGFVPLKEIKDWYHVQCHNCGGSATRETDTMDTFVDSSWYFLRYLDPKNLHVPFSSQAAHSMPVDLYIGGKEHAVLHLYYARFMNYFLHHIGLVPEPEPFKRLLVQGMVMGQSYRVKGSGKYLKPEEVDFSGPKPVEKESGKPLAVTWEKMSKSKYNGVDPEDVFKEFGTDTSRLFILADVSPRSHRNWTSATFPGVLNWQRRLWQLIHDFLKADKTKLSTLSEAELQKHSDFLFDSRNYYLKHTTFNYTVSQQLSVGISRMQGLTNSLRKVPIEVLRYTPEGERALATQLMMLAPLAPFFASELWSAFVSAAEKHASDIAWDRQVLEQAWPQVDADYELHLVCKLNGQETAVVKLPRRELDVLSEQQALQLALNQESVKKHHGDRPIVKTFFQVSPGYEAVLNIVNHTKTR